MKKSIFDQMKLKGPKQQEQKKNQQASYSQTHLGDIQIKSTSPFQLKLVSPIDSAQQSAAQLSLDQKQPKSNILQADIQQTPENHKYQCSIKQPSIKIPSIQESNPQTKQGLRRIESSNNSQIHPSFKIENNSLAKKSQQKNCHRVKKQLQQSQSEKNEKESEDGSDFKPNRSDFIEIPKVYSNEEIEFKKAPKTIKSTVTSKPNPLLTQITKIKPKETTVKDELNKLQSSSKPAKSNISSKEDKKKREKSLIMQELYQSHTRILEFMLKKKEAKEKIIIMKSQIIEMKDELSVLLNKQNNCIASEEYEMADKLQGKIEQIARRIQQQQAEVSLNQEEMFKLEFDSLTILRSHFDEEKRTVRRLKLVQLDVEDEITHFKRQSQETIQQTKTFCENQKKKLQRITIDIKNHAEQLINYQQTFYEDLHSAKQPLETFLNLEDSKRIQLEDQIKDIEEKLKKKKALLKSTLSSIQTTKQKIKQVDQNFEKEKEKLNSRKQHITLLEAQKAEQNRKMKEMEEQLKKLQKKNSDQIQKWMKQKKAYRKISTKIQQFFSNINLEEHFTQKEKAIEEFIEASKTLKQFQEKHKETKDKIKQLQFKKSNILSQITKNQERIKELKSRIPKLQSEQKQLSLAKNFKGAGMKKVQIKECTDEVAAIKKNVQDSYVEQAHLDAEIEQINTHQENYIQEENELRKALAMSQFRLALQKKKQLEKELSWLGELEKGNKIKNQYQQKLKSELQQIIEEINYISHEYELQNQNSQAETSNSKSNQKSSKSSSNPKSISSPEETEQSDSSGMPLAINEIESVHNEIETIQKQEQREQQVSNAELQDSGKNFQEEKKFYSQKYAVDLSQPLEIRSENNQSQKQSQNQSHNQSQDQSQNQRQNQSQSSKGQSVDFRNQPQNEILSKEPEQSGYVPLQLD